MRNPALAIAAAIVPLAACNFVRSASPIGTTGATSTDERSQPSTVAEREAAAADTEARRDKTPYEQLCARTVDKAGPNLGPNEGDTPRSLKKRWQPVVLAAGRDQFVVSRVAVDVSINYDHTKWLRRTIPAGEPLLLSQCYSPTQVRVRTIDGVFEKPVDISSLDLVPTSFHWDAPAPPKKSTVSQRISDAHSDDIAAIAGLRPLIDKNSECSVEATGQCMAAEKQVAAGPPRADLAAAKQRACDAAVDKVFARCMGKAEQKRLQQLSLQLELRTEKRVEDYHVTLKAKLGAGLKASR